VANDPDSNVMKIPSTLDPGSVTDSVPVIVKSAVVSGLQEQKKKAQYKNRVADFAVNGMM
jgi:hypothetical protein